MNNPFMNQQINQSMDNLFINNQINPNNIININKNDNLKKEIYNNNFNFDQNNFWVNLNQIDLINSIIDFCKKNENEHINYKNKVQIMKLINCLNPDFSKLKYTDNILDPLHYIEGEKKNIQFINSDFELFKVKVPINITKSDLYTIAKEYKTMHISEFLLIFNDCILEEDESSIDIIPDNGKIILIEDRIYPDDTYYNSLIEKNKMERMQSFRIEGPFTIVILFPSNITFLELKKAIHFKLGYNKKNLTFHNFNNENDFVSKLIGSLYISIAGKGMLGYAIKKYGKSVKCDVIIRNERHKLASVIGLLNSNKDLIKYIENILEIKVTKIFFNEKEINIYHEKSLSSLGIKNNFICTVETKPKE